MFLPFPKGWSRVVATQRHLNEGAAGKAILHQLDTRSEASIRRSQCGNSEAIVGVAVTYTSTLLPQVGGTFSKMLTKQRAMYFFTNNKLSKKARQQLLYRANGDVSPKRKPRSEWRGWEISFK